MKILLKTLFISLLILSFGGCGTTDSDVENGDNGNGSTPPPSYTLSTDVTPEGAGSINPGSGSFEEGSPVSVEATANDGFEFIQWTGTITSEDNPLQFNIDQNTNLTANFADQRSMYSVDLTVEDAEDEINLAFGQSEDEDFVYAPPPPPSGSLDARFLADGEGYYTLFKSNLMREASWELVYQSGSGDVLTLTWEITDTQMEGSLILSDSDDPAQSNQLEIDMRSDSEVQINVNEVERVFIHYRLD
jgi:hypothetical protein